MMVLEDLKHEMSLRNISRISGISLSGYYYRPRERHIQRLDPSTRARIKGIASERPTYGYRRVWAVLRNQGTAVNQRIVRKVLKDSNLSLPASKHRGRTKTRNLYKPKGPDQLRQTDITYIPTKSGMTCLMCIKGIITKEWQEYHYSRSCMAGDAIRSVENAVLMAFNGSVSKGLVLRTDNGPQYISHEFRSAMKLLWIKLEYIQKHTPEDNGDIESFHNSIKTDYILPNEFRDFHDASITIGKALCDYNECCLHSLITFLPGNSGGSS
jgi:transposase InsO family protein